MVTKRLNVIFCKYHELTPRSIDQKLTAHGTEAREKCTNTGTNRKIKQDRDGGDFHGRPTEMGSAPSSLQYYEKKKRKYQSA